MSDAAPAPVATTGTKVYKRVVLKVWQRYDNAMEIDYLQNNGWTIVCTEKLGEDCADGSAAVLYVMSNDLPVPLKPPALTDPGTINAASNTTFTLSLSMTRGRMILRQSDDPKTDILINPSPNAFYPSLAADFRSFPVTTGTNSKSTFALFCINDSAPVDDFQQANWAAVNVEAYCPGATPERQPVITNDQIPCGQSHMYRLVILGS